MSTLPPLSPNIHFCNKSPQTLTSSQHLHCSRRVRRHQPHQRRPTSNLESQHPRRLRPPRRRPIHLRLVSHNPPPLPPSQLTHSHQPPRRLLHPPLQLQPPRRQRRPHPRRPRQHPHPRNHRQPFHPDLALAPARRHPQRMYPLRPRQRRRKLLESRQRRPHNATAALRTKSRTRSYR